MPDGPEAFTVATDEVLAALVRTASSRLVVVAPAVSFSVASAIAARIQALESGSITLIFDSDPEVYRLGYGTLDAFAEVERAAAMRNVPIRRQPGIRIGLIIANDRTIIFTPTAALVEAGPNTQGAANAICLSAPPRAIESDLGMRDGTQPSVGRSRLTSEDIGAVKRDLEANPPQKFDLARKVRVFNAFFDFVELKVIGADLARRTVALPPHLLAVADKKTRKQIETRFRLLSPEDKLSGKAIAKDRDLVTRRYLHHVANFGSVVLHREKEGFLKEVDALRATVEKFSKEVEARIQQQIDKAVSELVKALLPALAKRPPSEWVPSSGVKPDRDTVKLFLERDLRKAFGSAGAIIQAMDVRCAVKGVTYDMLTDPHFLEAAAKALPELQKRFHKEFDAAKAKAEQPSFLPE